MINLFVFVIIFSSFIVSALFIPVWIKKAKQIGLLWKDMNKINAELVAGSGGVIAVLAFIIGVFIFVAHMTFYGGTSEYLVEIFALMLVVVILGAVGLVDDILGWQRGGLSVKSRILMLLFSAVPLIVINAGKSVISLPFLGMIDIGLIYPLIVIPLGIIGAGATFNILAGFNGLEAGQGIILLSGMGLVAYFTGSFWLALILFCMVFALAGFWTYNTYPAKVFPGDSLTYAVGGLIATSAILGNFEKIAVFFFIPYILEVFLKLRGKLKKYSFGKPNREGSLDLPYDKFYSLNHVSIYLLKRMNLKSNERNATILINAFQLIIIILGFIIFNGALFK